MIRREEFNKILKLIDAGILASNDNLVDVSKLSNDLVGYDSFEVDFKIGSIDDPIVINETNSIDTTLVNVQEFIDYYNEKEQLKLSKNKYTLSWGFSFYGLTIDIEDILFDTFQITTDKFKTNEAIRTYLTSAFKIVKPCLINPMDNGSIIDAKGFGFKLNLDNLIHLRTLDNVGYSNLIKDLSDDGEIKLTLSYSISLIVSKG